MEPRLTSGLRPARHLLSALPEPGRQTVLSVATRRSYAPAAVLVRHGDSATELFIIESGRAAVRLTTPNGDSVTLAVLGPGDVLGEVGALQTHQRRTATVEALEPISALVLRWSDLEPLRHEHPDVSDFLLRLAARRIEKLSQLVVEAHHLPVATRVARRLYEIGRHWTAVAGPPVIPLSQQEIAQIAGATRPTTNQVLKALQAEGVIALSRASIVLLDLPKLRTLCSW